ncbi:MAG TPA: asparaginase [Gemmatimonadaceae bacterium]|nr:asparaginase [Gemmatimonadaceae bacterium]
MDEYSLDVVVTRGPTIESRHRVHAAVVGWDDSLVGAARDHGMVTMWRSCAKFFQVLPFLSSGGFDELGWGEEELALACASHGGEPEHLAVAQRMLDSMELEEGDLACGAHEPLSARGAKLARESGRPLSRLHNNCSGKHAAMLGRARTAGWPTKGYERADHSVQRGCLGEVARWSDVQIDDMPIGVDGCGVTVMALPLDRMARAYARWGRAVQAEEEHPARVATAVRHHPHLLGGTDRFDTILLEESSGAVIAKVGAEGVHSLTVPQAGLGIALKVEDGGLRAQHVAVLRLLQLLDVLPETLSPRLAEWATRPIRNTRGETVGEIRSEV